MSVILIRTHAVLFAVAVLSACGGGGGSGEASATQSPSIDARLSPSQIALSYNFNSFDSSGQASAFALQAAISSNAPPSTFVFVSGDPTVLSAQQVALNASGAGFYATTVKFKPDLPPGTYSGSLNLKLCKEITCETQYPITGAGTLPYTVTVTNDVEFKIEGAPIGQTRLPTLATNTPVVVTSNMPVNWTLEPPSGLVKVVSQTSTSWTGMFSAKSLSGEGQFGAFSLTAIPVSQTAKGKKQDFAIFFY